MKLPYHVRKYPPFTTRFGSSSRSTLTDACQLYGRLPQPVDPVGSGELTGDEGAEVGVGHRAALGVGAGASRSQSGRKLPRRGLPTGNVRSFQERVVLLTAPAAWSKSCASPVVFDCT